MTNKSLMGLLRSVVPCTGDLK